MLSRVNPNKERFIQGKRIFFSSTKLVVIRDYRVRSIGQGRCWGLGVKGSFNFFIVKRNMQENIEGKGKSFVTQFIPKIVK